MVETYKTDMFHVLLYCKSLLDINSMFRIPYTERKVLLKHRKVHELFVCMVLYSELASGIMFAIPLRQMTGTSTHVCGRHKP